MGANTSNEPVQGRDEDQQFVEVPLNFGAAVTEKIERHSKESQEVVEDWAGLSSWTALELEGNSFRFGGDPFQEHVIYTRIGLPDDATEAVAPYFYPECKTGAVVSIKYYGNEFIRRRIPFHAPSRKLSLDFKFKLKCQQNQIGAVVAHLSCVISVLLADTTGSAADDNLFESDEIFYGSLAYTMASLSVSQFSHVKSDPKTTNYVDCDCYVFVDRPSSVDDLETVRHCGNLCTGCSEGSHLMAVFNEVRNLTGTIDLTTPADETVVPMEMYSVVSSTSEDGDDESTEPSCP